jgi:hypothetical protein
MIFGDYIFHYITWMLKDLLQTFLYEFDHNEYYKNFFSILSYIHICFQPLFINMLLSYFSKAALIYNSSY